MAHAADHGRCIHDSGAARGLEGLNRLRLRHALELPWETNASRAERSEWHGFGAGSSKQSYSPVYSLTPCRGWAARRLRCCPSSSRGTSRSRCQGDGRCRRGLYPAQEFQQVPRVRRGRKPGVASLIRTLVPALVEDHPRIDRSTKHQNRTRQGAEAMSWSARQYVKFEDERTRALRWISAAARATRPRCWPRAFPVRA
jgi:hypothetical protein